MKYLSSLLYLTSLLAVVDGVTFLETEEGMEFVVDYSELTGPKDVDQTLAAYDGFDREYEYDEGTDASLLNQLIAFFLPHVNSAFQAIVPDPMPVPLKGTINLPQISLLGYCNADASIGVDFGTLVGMSGLSIDRIQVLSGTEQVSAGWNKDQGCLETIFNAFFDIQVSSKRVFTVNDMYGGIQASVCGYSVDESISGGMNTFAPKMHGSVNISGSLTGTLASLKIADIKNAFKIGYDRIEGFVDQAPPSLNQVIANVTSELSVLAKNEILGFVMDEQLMRAVEPTVNKRSKEAIQGREVDLDVGQALRLNTAFMRNKVGEEVDNMFGEGTSEGVETSVTAAVENTVETVETAVNNLVGGTMNFLSGLGFRWNGAINDGDNDGDNDGQ